MKVLSSPPKGCIWVDCCVCGSRLEVTGKDLRATEYVAQLIAFSKGSEEMLRSLMTNSTKPLVAVECPFCGGTSPITSEQGGFLQEEKKTDAA